MPLFQGCPFWQIAADLDRSRSRKSISRWQRAYINPFSPSPPKQAPERTKIDARYHPEIPLCSLVQHLTATSARDATLRHGVVAPYPSTIKAWLCLPFPLAASQAASSPRRKAQTAFIMTQWHLAQPSAPTQMDGQRRVCQNGLCLYKPHVDVPVAGQCRCSLGMAMLRWGLFWELLCDNGCAWVATRRHPFTSGRHAAAPERGQRCVPCPSLRVNVQRRISGISLCVSQRQLP